MSTVYDTVADVICKRFRIERSKVRPDVSFEDLGLDSLSQIELATLLQKEFGVTISDDDIDGMASVADVVNWLEQQGTAAQ